jgi:uracil phosphoribosyltransferase
MIQSKFSGETKDTSQFYPKTMRFPNLRIVEHPLAQDITTKLRESSTAPAEFRTLCKRLTLVLFVEASRDLHMRARAVQTPLEQTEGSALDESVVATVILRAGLGMLDPIVELLPDVAVGYIGLERNEATAIASSYYAKLPPRTQGQTVFLLDPMLATGGSASQACDLIARHNPARIIMLCVVAAPQGVQRMLDAHPDVRIYAAALDRDLDHRSYIVPGLGDFGDRLYGT